MSRRDNGHVLPILRRWVVSYTPRPVGGPVKTKRFFTRAAAQREVALHGHYGWLSWIDDRRNLRVRRTP